MTDDTVPAALPVPPVPWLELFGPDVFPQAFGYRCVDAWNELLARPRDRERFEQIMALPDGNATITCDDDGVVRIRGEQTFGPYGRVEHSESRQYATDNREALARALTELTPWRKGPFEVHGQFIDAEWRSELKWRRVVPFLGDLTGQRVVDVGSNNGYYLFRLLHHDPRLLLGIDPQGLYAAQFAFVQRLAAQNNAEMAPVGVDDLRLCPGFFDTILCMGLLYHVTDPVQTLRTMRDALAPKGQIVLETIVIAGQGSHALFPEARYTGARGFYFLPTVECLRAWVRRAGMRVLEESEPVPTTSDEQRTTHLRPGDSLAEGLDPEDPTRTIEGHPAPQRIVFRVQR